MRLRSHLVILALGAALPLLIFSIAIVRQEPQDQRAVLDRGMRDTARALSLAVDGEVKALRAVLETLAASAYLDTGDLKAFYELCARTVEGRKNEYIVLFDPSGQQLVNSSRPFGSPLPNPLVGARAPGTDSRYPDAPVGGAEPVKRVLETGRPVVSDLFVSLVTRQPRISLDVPVVRSGTVRYVLELSLDPDIFTQLLVNHHLPADSVASILDRKGLAIARSLDPSGRVGRPLAADLAAQIGKSEGVSATGHTFEGVPVYYVFTRSESTGWTTSLAVSQAAVGRSLRRSVTLLTGGVAIALLLAGGLAFIIGKRIATPISTLAGSASSLARGEHVDLNASAVREMKELQNALVIAGETVREVAAERAGREAAEAVARRASFLSRATTALASSLEYEGTLRAVADLIVPQVADGCAFDVAAEGSIRRVALRHRDPAKEAIAWELSRRYAAEAGELIEKAIATRRATLLTVVDDAVLYQLARDADHLALLRAAEIHSIVVAPIVVRDTALGALTLLSSTSGRRFGSSDLVLAEDLALRVGYAMDNARLYRDVKLAREAADAANRTKDEFLATLSHELRTPLNAVYGWARMLRAGQIREEAAERALEAIIRNANAQVQLIDDLLDVSRIIAGKMRLDVRSVDLKAVIEAALDAVRPAAAAKEISLQSVLDSNAAPVMGDPARLQQVVWNLLLNAVKFTPKGGRVQVHLLRINSHVEIVVSDTGQGIPAEVLPFIFARFRQGDSSSTRAQSGLGLGLALVKHLAELHGGSVGAQSGGEGKGATFIVKLPLSIAQIPTEPTPRVHPTATPLGAALHAVRLDGIRVLVVDDDQDALDLASAILSAAGATVRTCRSVGVALELLAQWRPDVLVSDIEIPEEDGYSLIRKVRALEADRGGKTPAIALTAYGRTQDRMRSLTAGYNMHVPKPVDPGELTTIIASLAGRAPEPMLPSDS
jgi:signal transduction histidine kinase/ActR/RegA family two-component response regulator